MCGDKIINSVSNLGRWRLWGRNRCWCFNGRIWWKWTKKNVAGRSGLKYCYFFSMKLKILFQSELWTYSLNSGNDNSFLVLRINFHPLSGSFERGKAAYWGKLASFKNQIEFYRSKNYSLTWKVLIQERIDTSFCGFTLFNNYYPLQMIHMISRMKYPHIFHSHSNLRIIPIFSECFSHEVQKECSPRLPNPLPPPLRPQLHPFHLCFGANFRNSSKS